MRHIENGIAYRFPREVREAQKKQIREAYGRHYGALPELPVNVPAEAGAKAGADAPVEQKVPVDQAGAGEADSETPAGHHEVGTPGLAGTEGILGQEAKVTRW